MARIGGLSEYYSIRTSPSLHPFIGKQSASNSRGDGQTTLISGCNSRQSQHRREDLRIRVGDARVGEGKEIGRMVGGGIR